GLRLDEVANIVTDAGGVKQCSRKHAELWRPRGSKMLREYGFSSSSKVTRRNPQRTYVDRSAWSPPKPFEVASARKTWSSQDPRPPPHIDKITENLIRYQPVVSRINKWGTSTSRRPPQRVHRTDPEQKAPHRRRMETLCQAGSLRTWSLRWMNVTTRFMEVLKTFINKRQWSPSTKVWGMKRVSTAVPRPKKEAEPRRRRRNPPARMLPQAYQGPKQKYQKCESTCTKTLRARIIHGTRGIIALEQVKKSGYLGFHPHQHPLSLIVAFYKKQHAARKLDSDQLPSGRMRYLNRKNSGLRQASGPRTYWFPKNISGFKDHVSNSRPQGPEPTGSPKNDLRVLSLSKLSK
ncbi:hypothetical protein IGI04_012179, partial [Brassica rapa subsp. trilocularis]